MNMIEIVFLLVRAVAAVIGWLVAAHRWGVYFGVAGAIVGYFLPWLLLVLVNWINSKRLNRWPLRPRCENGCCKWDNYQVLRMSGDEVEFVCKCGNKYLKSGRRFMKLDDEGHRQPYKVLRPGRHWCNDDGEARS